MYRKVFLIALLVVASFLFPVVGYPISSNTNEPNEDQLSYAIGFETGKSFKNHNIKANSAYFSKGVKEGLNQTKTPWLSESEVQKILKQYRKATIARQQNVLKELARENREKGEEFLEEKQSSPGVITVSNGIAYKILESGIGNKPTLADRVKVDYVGTHIDGQKFDANKSAVFTLRNLIAGWQTILPMMKEGDFWEVYIPSRFAYGSEGAPGVIDPNETLVYKIRLIKINP